MSSVVTSVVTIVCSDKTRNGKTLLARLYADIYSLRKDKSPIVFDTDLSGNGIINFLPDKTRMTDLSRVADQVELFDTMLELTANGANGANGRDNEDGGPDFVVDVAANELNRFFRIFSDIGFERGAFEVQLDIQVCHVISWTLKSLKTAARIRDLISTGRFVAVRNMAIEEVAFTPTAQEEAHVPDIEIDLFLNALTPEAYRIVNQPAFSFADFISGGNEELPYEIRADIWNFLEDVYNQTRQSVVN